LAQLLSPFLPFSSNIVKETLGIQEYQWKPIDKYTTTLKNVSPLFERIDVSTIDIEVKKLNKQSYI
jgi:methionyl-tRNA synthetase